MDTLPEYIFVLACRRPKKHRDALRILKEYLAGIPHILSIDKLWGITTTYYIMPYNNTIDSALSNINSCLRELDIDIFGSALFKLNHASQASYTYELWSHWHKVLPLSIVIKHKDIPTLKLFSEGMKDA